MSGSRQALSLILPPARALVLGVVVLGTAVLIAGCASRQASHHSGYAQMGAQRVAIASPRVEIEDDGLPAQTPPPRQASTTPDDPREPWSRHYGRPAAPAASAGPAPRPATGSATAIPPALRAVAPAHPLPPARHVRLSQAEEEDIIMRAIADHEQRRQ